MADIIGTESDDTLTGTTDMDTITGLGGNDTINADDGADIIYGGDGDDIINAGAGGDFIVGGGGADAIDGGDGIDTVNYFGALTGVTVNLSDAAQNTGDAAGDTFVNVENVEGSTFDDLIIGDNAANDLRGGEGNDVIYGDTPTLTEEIGLGFINQGTTTNQMLYLYPFNAMPTDGSFTVEFLLQHSANTPGQIDPYLSFAASTTNSNALFIFIENNDLLRFILNGTIYNTTVARDDLADGDVHRLSMTFNEATDQVRIFIDGALADEVTIANGRAIMSNFGALVFGQDQDTLASGFDPSQVFEGGLGDIRIWNGIRTDQEIADTWNYLLDDPANEDLAANWVVNPVTGAISDISGNGLILRPLTTTKTNITLTTLGSFESGPFANPDGGNDVISGGDGDDTLYGVSGNCWGMRALTHSTAATATMC